VSGPLLSALHEDEPRIRLVESIFGLSHADLHDPEHLDVDSGPRGTQAVRTESADPDSYGLKGKQLRVPLAHNLAVQALDYFANVLASSLVFYLPARWLCRRSVLGHEHEQPA
jgi:hypothetical protein